jgi:hypothetical protein
MDDKLLSRINKFVEELVERPLTLTEQNDLTQFAEANYKFVADKKTVVQVAELANEFADMLENKKEYLINNNLNLVSFLGIDSFDRFIDVFNPKTKRKIAYMTLDSRYAQFNNACTKLTWNFTNSLNIVNNSTNVVGVVRDITSIRMHSMVVRKFSSPIQRATILIEELAAQSFIMPGGRRFHFVGLLNNLTAPIKIGARNTSSNYLVPEFSVVDKFELLAGYKFNEGYYRFNIPITTLNDITISIGNPDTLVVIPKYEFKKVTVLDLQTDHVDLELNEPHHYLSPNNFAAITYGTWYSVFIDGFDSVTKSDNEFLNCHEFTLVEILSETQIRIIFHEAVSGGAASTFAYNNRYITAGPAPWTCGAVRFNSYRVIMNFELEYISD